MLRTVFVWSVGGAMTMLYAAAAFLMACLERKSSFFKVMQSWGRLILRLSDIRVIVRGTENIGQGPYLFIANHQGNCDIVLVCGYLPRRFHWIAKKELLKAPLMGMALKRSGQIMIDRADPQQAYSCLDKAAEYLKQGASIVMFPEGTRSRSGAIGPFKRGVSYLAWRSGIPIVPVLLHGCRERMLPGAFRVNPGTVSMNIWPPVETAGRSLEECQEALEQIRQRMIEEFGRLDEGKTANRRQAA